MRNPILIACLLLIAGTNAVTATTIGIYADQAGHIPMVTVNAGSSFPVYLVATGGLGSSGLSGFYCRIVTSDNVVLTYPWNLVASGQNIATDPEDLAVAYPVPLPNAAAVVLAQTGCTLLEGEVGYIYFEAFDLCHTTDNDPYYISGDPVQIDTHIPLDIPVDAYGDPVFTINSCSTPKVWTIPTTGGPSPRAAYVMALDNIYHTGLLFGGKGPNPTDFYDDTWYWHKPGYWDIVDCDPAPPARKSAFMVYDKNRGKFILFGGHDENGIPGLMDDTWEFDPITDSWTLRDDLPLSPPPRAYGGSAYDTDRGITVIYGGVASTGRFRDTWEYDGTTYVKKCDSCTPGYLAFQGMAYDEGIQKVVMFGGERDGSVFMGRTYTYDGSTWTLVSSTGPEARVYPAMAYDPQCGGVMLFGGKTAAGYQNDTWIFKDGTWTQLDPGKAAEPVARTQHTLVYDVVANGFMTFGGIDATGMPRGDTCIFGAAGDSTSSVNPPGDLPAVQSTHSNYPNPFNPQTTIRFSLVSDGPVKLTVFDLRGRPIKVLVDERRLAGINETTWNGTDEAGNPVASGVYAYQLVTGEGVFVGKMAILK